MKKLLLFMALIFAGGLIGCANNPTPSAPASPPMYSFEVIGHDLTNVRGLAVTPDVNGDFDVTVIRSSMDVKADARDAGHDVHLILKKNGVQVDMDKLSDHPTVITLEVKG